MHGNQNHKGKMSKFCPKKQPNFGQFTSKKGKTRKILAYITKMLYLCIVKNKKTMAKINSIAHIECNSTGYYTVYTKDEFPFGFFGEGNSAEEAKSDFLAIFEAFREDHKKKTGEDIDAEFEFVMDEQ